MPSSVFIESIGLLGPGLGDWTQGSAVLAGQQPYIHAPTALPAPAGLPQAERRRTGPTVRLALAIGQQAVAASGMDAADLPTIFTSSSADGQNFHAICEALAAPDPLMSPTRFHNSVHNAPAGYWSIAAGAMRPSNVLCAMDGSFGAGFLEGVAQVAADQAPCLLIAYDTGYPEPLHSHRPIPDPFGVALLLTPQATARTLAQVWAGVTHAPATTMADAALEQLRKSAPAARALPLLQAVATGTTGTVVLDYLDELRLEVGITPMVPDARD
ncbi:beta-ketoacyl synthase chain length factor [Cupriavidus sp. IDO]|uniref:beta-ketoacyl synthase chain length factor n=1 Tax=Cupriavidus sp. IDO TaxID=1539142 RepID=UPI00057974E6|nr:beta-ketoacyl synthase chain length factor [Cupriavidus sp. IDO]KWR77171.1 3-oxoacyl-ACP synthase [Cupriavidus sp. IDO]